LLPQQYRPKNIIGRVNLNDGIIIQDIPKSWADIDTIAGRSFLIGPNDEMAGSIYHKWEIEDELLINDPHYLTGIENILLRLRVK
jgi:hypothetical protein